MRRVIAGSSSGGAAVFFTAQKVQELRLPGAGTSQQESETSGVTLLPRGPSTLCLGFANLGCHFLLGSVGKGSFSLPVRIMSLP